MQLMPWTLVPQALLWQCAWLWLGMSTARPNVRCTVVAPPLEQRGQQGQAQLGQQWQQAQWQQGQGQEQPMGVQVQSQAARQTQSWWRRKVCRWCCRLRISSRHCSRQKPGTSLPVAAILARGWQGLYPPRWCL